MKFDFRKYDCYAICSIEAENTTIDLGMLDRGEVKSLLEDFKAAIDDLEWFLYATDRGET